MWRDASPSQWKVSASDNDIDLWCPKCPETVTAPEWSTIVDLFELMEKHRQEKHE